jgi:hypothetical protein
VPMKDYCFAQNEQKRLKRLNTVKSAISSIAKHDDWTQKQVEKRASEILTQKRMTEINQAKVAAKEGIKVLTGNKSTTQSELTRCGLRLRFSVEGTDCVGVRGEDNRRTRQRSSSNKSYAKGTTNKHELSKQSKELQHGDIGDSKLSESMQRQRIEVLSTKQRTRKQKLAGYGEENVRDTKSYPLLRGSTGILLTQENGTSARESSTKTDGHIAIVNGGDFDRDISKSGASPGYSTSLLPAESSLDDYSYDDDFSPQ